MPRVRLPRLGSRARGEGDRPRPAARARARRAWAPVGRVGSAAAAECPSLHSSYGEDGGASGALGRRDHEGRSRTSPLGRADPGGSRPLARPDQGGCRTGQRRARAARLPTRRPDLGRREPHRRWRARRPVPDRRLPDRLGHLVEHDATRCSPRSPDRASTRTTTSTWASRRTTSSRRPCTLRRSTRSTKSAAGDGASRCLARGEGAGVRRRRQVGTDALDGRRPRHARSGVRAAMPPRCARASTRVRDTLAAARPDPARRHRRPAPGSTRTRSSLRACASCSPTRPASRSRAPADPFEAQAARDGDRRGFRSAETVAVSPTKVANDIRFLGSGPRAGLAEIALPELQKGARSCRAR